VFDGNGGTTTAIANITVTAVNDAPIAVADAFNVQVDGVLTTTLGVDDLLLNDIDAEGDPLTVNTMPVSESANGSLSLNADGTFTYTPFSEFTSGTDNFTYEITDGLLTSQALVTITVVPPPLLTPLADDNWSTAANWDSGTVPLATEDVNIPIGRTLTANGITLDYLSFDLSGGLNVVNTTLAGPGDLTLSGSLEARNSNSIVNSFFVAPMSNLLIDADDSTQGQLTVLTGFTNSGTITFDHSGTTDNASTLNISTGTFTNAGLITTLDTNGGKTDTHQIFATDGGGNNIINTGTIDVGSTTAAVTFGGVFDTSAGTVNIQSGQQFYVGNSTTNFGTGTILSGPGIFFFSGSAAINLTSNFTVTPTQATLGFNEFGGSDVTISGVGDFIVDLGASVIFDTNETILTGLVNNGDVEVRNSSNNIDGALTLSAGSNLVIDGDDGLTGQLTIAQSFTNDGTITLDHSGTSDNVSELTIFPSILSNAGLITTLDTNGGMSGLHVILGGIINTGTIDIGKDTRISGLGVDTFDTSAGIVNIQSGQVLVIENNTTVFGLNTTLSGAGTFIFSGTAAVNLTGDFNVTPTQPLIAFNSSDVTISGVGDFIVDAAASVIFDTNETIQSGVVNNGDIEFRNENNNINGTLTLGAGSTLYITANDTKVGQLTIANGFTNDGIITLDHDGVADHNSTLTVTAGTLTNEGTLVTQDIAGGSLTPHEITAQITNNAAIDIGHDTRIINAGLTFDTSLGSVNVQTGKTLTIDSGSTNFGPSTSLTGTGGISLIGAHNLNLSSNFTLDNSTQPFLSFGGTGTTVTVGGAGLLNLVAGTNLQLDKDVINTDLTVSTGASLLIVDEISTIGSSVFTQDGQLIVTSTAAGGTPATLNVSSSFTNNGFIFIDNEADLPLTTNFNQTGTITNSPSGVIYFENTGGNAGGTRNFSGSITNNSGLIDVNFNSIIGGGSIITDNGGINVTGGHTLTINSSSITFGTNTSLTSTGTIDLNGNKTISLTSNFSITSGQPNILFDNADVTISGAFDFRVNSGSSVLFDTNELIQSNLVNDGEVEFRNSNNSITGALTLGPTSTLIIDADDSMLGQLTIANGFFNDGIITLDHTGTTDNNSSLTLIAGTLTNAGTIITQDLFGGSITAHEITAQITNDAFIDIGHDTIINNAGFDFDNTIGSINVLFGKTLTIENGTTTIGVATALRGGGDINLSGTHGLNVTTDFTIMAADPKLNFSGLVTVSGLGEFVIGTGAHQVITADIFSNELRVNPGGELEVREGDSIIDSTTFIQDGKLYVNSTAAGNASVTFANGFTNNGLITIDSEDSGLGKTTTLTVTAGSLINDGTSIIELVNTGGNAGGSRDIAAQLDNQGELNVAHTASLNQTAANHLNQGLIFIDPLATLTVTGSTLDNTVNGQIEGGGTLDVSAVSVFTNDALLVPGGEFQVDTLTIAGSVLQGASAVLLLDVASTASHDILDVIVGDYEIAGALDLKFLPGHDILGTNETITVVTAGSITAGTYTVTHNLGNAFTVTALQNGNNVDVNINATFENIFSNNAVDGLWSSANNWTANTLPVPADNVLINNFTVTHGAPVTDIITSLTLQGGTVLNLTNGQITTSQESNFSAASTFNLTGGTFQADADLFVSGDLNFTSGQLNGTGTTYIDGTFTTPAGGPKNIDGTMAIRGGTGTINNASTFDGGGFIIISPFGDLLVDGSTVNVDIQNFGILQAEGTTVFGGTSFVQEEEFIIQTNDAGIAIVNVDAPTGFTNNGLLTLDSTVASSATLNVPNGTLTNTDTILSTSSNATAGNERIITASLVDNSGAINVEYDLIINSAGQFTQLGSIDIDSGAVFRINLSSSIFDGVSGKSINIAPGGILEINNSPDTFLGNLLSGTGTISLFGTQNLHITNDYTLTANTPYFDLGNAGTITIVGSGGLLRTGFDGQLDLSGDTISADFENFGTTVVQEASTISSTNFLQAGSLTILTDGIAAGSLSVTNGFTNTGVITLDVTANGDVATLMVGGTLTNDLSGLIFSTTSNLSTATTTVINTNLDNQGSIDIANDLTIDDTGTFQNSGNITIASEATLTITSSAGGNNTGSIVLNGLTGVTAATTVLDVSGVTGPIFNNTGVISGIGTVTGSMTGNAPSVGTSPGLVTITENFVASGTSLLEAELEGEEAGISYDQLVVLGTATLRGSLNTTLLNNYQAVSGTSYAILTAGLLLGSFDEASGLDVSKENVLDLHYDNNMVTLNLVDSTDIGTSADDIITASGDHSVIVAGDGDDTINNSGSDGIIYAQSGNDVISVASDFKRVDGGEGVDTLVIAEDTNFTEIQGTQIDRVEVLSLDDNNADTIALDSDSIAKIVDGDNDLTGIENSLVVLGNLGDSVNLGGDFLFSGKSTLDAGRGEESFRMFSDGDSTLLVSDELSLELTDSNGSVFVFNSGDANGHELVSQNIDTPNSEDHIDLGGVNSLPSMAPTTPDIADLDLSDVLIEDQQDELSALFGGLNDVEAGAISLVGSTQTSGIAGGGDSLTTYFSDGSSSQFVIYTNLIDGESFL
jgi:hypothetical protein